MPDNPVALHPLVMVLADRIRAKRAELPELDDLALEDELAAVQGTLDGERLFIGNELHRCKGMRKLHLELARLGNGLQILHCVWVPDPCFDLPIFGADIVAGPAGISAAIVDLSPVKPTLPTGLEASLSSLSIPPFRQVRELPGWGTIFSPYVRFIRPDGAEEEAWFVELVDSYLGLLSEAVRRSTPDSADSLSTIERYEGQLNYCLKQKRNDKTRRVLEKAFNPSWADAYIENLLFDNPAPPV